MLVTTRDRTVTVGHGGRPKTVQPLPRADACTLFAARASADHESRQVDELCELLGDLPLAINLAAGYVVGFSEPIESYLSLLCESRLGETLHLGERRDLSVPATFDLTYRRLEEDPCYVLAVIALDGGETMTRAAVVAGTGWLSTPNGEGRIRQACNDLVRHSLVERDGERFRLHSLVRRYCVEHLREETRTAILDRLTTHYLAFAEEHCQPTRENYDALELEMPSLLAVMDHAYRQEQWGLIKRFARALANPVGGVLDVRGYDSELTARLQQALHAAEAEGAKMDAAAFMVDLGIQLQVNGDYQGADELHRKSLKISEELGNQAGIASALHQLGILAHARRDYEEARRLYRRSLEIKTELEDRAGMSRTFYQLGRLAHATMEYDEAAHLLRESLALAEELGNWGGISSSLHQLGRLALTVGNHAEASQLFHRSLKIAQELDIRIAISSSLGQLARLAKYEGDPIKAERLYKDALEIAESIGALMGTRSLLWGLAGLYEDQYRFSEGLALLERVVEIDKRLDLCDLGHDLEVLSRVRSKLT